MKVKIRKKKVEYEIIDVDVPYYYKHNLGVEHGSSFIFGCIDRQKITSIRVSVDAVGKKTYAIDIEPITGDTALLYYTTYFESINASSKAEFLAAASEALQALQTIQNEQAT